MKRPLIVTVCAIAAFLALGGAIRISERPYIDYAEGRYAEAMDGLRNNAEHGDQIAPFLVAMNYERGVLGTADIAQASDWYVRAARIGDIRSISRYINLNIKNPDNAEQCSTALAILNSAARTGDLGSLTMLSRYYETGFCAQIDLVTAARYYMALGRIDRRYNDVLESIVTRLDPEIAHELHPLPEKFDGDQDVALAQFLAALPLGPARSTP